MSGVWVQFECPDCGPTRASACRFASGVLTLVCMRCGEGRPARFASPSGGDRPAPMAPMASGAAPGVSGTRSRATPLTVLPGAGRPRAAPVPVDAVEAARALPPVPSGVCPSCLRPRQELVPRCAGCGLDLLHADPAAFAPSARLCREWALLNAAWDDPSAHAHFLTRAQAARELREAGRLYRLRLLQDPEDAAAEEALEHLVQRTLASALASEATQTDPDALRARRRLHLMGAILVVALLMALLAMMM